MKNKCRSPVLTLLDYFSKLRNETHHKLNLFTLQISDPNIA